MTECTPTSLPFATLNGRRVEADFSGGALTTDAGALLLREADRRLGLLDTLDRCLPDPRDPDLITHPQRVFGIATGYEDLNDHQSLRHDPLWQALADYAPDPQQPLASAPTLCRLENRAGRSALFRMAAALVEQFVASFDRPPECLVLDFDATDDPVHGRQEGRFFHGYYDSYCFLPLYVFCGDQLLVAYLRPANIDPARHTRAILKLLARRLRQAWPDVRLIIRGDSGFRRWRLMRLCDHNGVGYVLGLARNSRLQELAAPLMAEAAARFEAARQPVRLFGTLGYAAGPWDRARWVVVKAEHNAGGDNPRFVVTNLPGDAQALYDEAYCARGEMENRIKEQQLMLFADRTSCHKFRANQFRLLLSAAAYVLVEAVRRLGLAGTELARAQVSTIRLRLFKVAAAGRAGSSLVVVFAEDVVEFFQQHPPLVPVQQHQMGPERAAPVMPECTDHGARRLLPGASVGTASHHVQPTPNSRDPFGDKAESVRGRVTEEPLTGNPALFLGQLAEELLDRGGALRLGQSGQGQCLRLGLNRRRLSDRGIPVVPRLFLRGCGLGGGVGTRLHAWEQRGIRGNSLRLGAGCRVRRKQGLRRFLGGRLVLNQLAEAWQ